MAKTPNISNLSIMQLKQLVAKAEKQIARKKKEQVTIARKAAEKTAKEHGFSLDELVGGMKKKASTPKGKRMPLPPKYKNPDNASETWSGRGRQPEWYKAATAAGKKPEDLAI